jgi:hypothetical protein
MARRPAPTPAPIARAALRFAAWRKTRTQREIPAELWRLAVGLAGRYGVSLTARALRLRYYDLKRRLEAEPARVAPGLAPRPSSPGAAFVELLPAPSRSTAECVIELEAACGTKLRVELKGADAPDLLALGRLFLERSA